MIIDTIALHNFGVFRGRQEATLTPPSKSKPIVLVGGFNGGGKTTLLEGLQLALYGRHAPSAKQSGIAYDEYLRRCIHRRTSASEGASVELTFRSNEDGAERSYRLRRSWTVPNGRTHEHLEVFADGQYDAALSDAWLEQVERFIPGRLAHLFLFDGERVEALADPDKSRTLLATAVHALLGVDLVDQLKQDLAVLDRRKSRETKTEDESAAIAQLEEQIDRLESHLNEIAQQRASINNDRQRTAKKLRELEDRLTEQGGLLLERRHEIEREQADLQGQLRAIEAQLIGVAAGALPLVLVRSLLSDASEQAEREDRAARADVLMSSLEEHDRRLLEVLRAAGGTKAAIAKVEAFCKAERMQADASSRVDRYLDTDAHCRSQLRSLLAHRVHEEARHARALLDQAEKLHARLHVLDRKLAVIPDREAVSGLLKDRDALQRDLAALDAKLASFDERRKQYEHEKNVRSGELDKLLRLKRAADFESQDVSRFLKHSGRVRRTLDRFRTALVAQQVKQLQELILTGYRQLLRKKTLVSSIQIAPEDCALTLFGNDGQPLPEERLSAGERQLLAVAILWGLAKAAGRPLPTVIDTPLGRLDASHRTHLVERYFPYASHQVVLLSTDKEIDQEYYDRLRPWVGHSYRLSFDDSSSSTAIERGYFW